MYTPVRRRAACPSARPALPLHVARIAASTAPSAACRWASVVEVEYDVPPDAWYFDEQRPPRHALRRAPRGGAPAVRLAGVVHRQRTAPADEDVVFRNLDGNGTRAPRGIAPTSAGSCTRTRLKSLSTAGGLIILGFDVVGARRRRVCVRAERRRSASSQGRGHAGAGRARRQRRRAPPLRRSRRGRSISRAARRATSAAPRAARRPAASMIDRVTASGQRAAPMDAAASAARRTSTPASGSSRRTSSRIRCSPARSASRP